MPQNSEAEQQEPSRSACTQNQATQAKPYGFNRFGKVVLATGLALYLIVLGVGLTEIGIRTGAAAKAGSVVAVLSMLFPLAALSFFMMEFLEGTITGTPVAWYRYTLSVMKQQWLAIVGTALMAIALLAILAAASI